jgi:hypothetical protein
MPGEADWKPCLFGADGSLEHPQVHDNFVCALAVHLEQRVLVLHTQYRDGPGPHELTDLRFVGLVAHHFDDVAEPSILLDVERVSAEWVVGQWQGLFASRQRYGWPPIHFSDLADLARQLAGLGVLGYRVMGSCGLDGFVLASGAEHSQREQPVDLGRPLASPPL